MTTVNRSLKSVNGRCRRCTGSGNIHDIKMSDTAVGIAPEGTRSVTGQLLPFKKGELKFVSPGAVRSWCT